MATVKSLQRQVTSTEGRLVKASQQVSMYTARVASALAAASKLVKQEVTEGSYKELLDTRSLFDIYFRISDNIERRDSARASITDLEARLQDLRSQVASMQSSAESHEITLGSMVTALDGILGSFRAAWYETMLDKHAGFYQRIQKLVPQHKARFEKLQRIFAPRCMSGAYIFAHRRMYKMLKEVMNSERSWMHQPAVVMTEEAYMTRVHRELDCSWADGIKLLAEKCIRYDVCLDELEVQGSPAMTGLGIEVVLKDKKPRVLHVRVIWAAEYSELVAPHTRYIITERRA